MKTADTPHNSTKNAVKSTGQKIDNLLQSMHKMFDELPSCREDCKKLAFAKVIADYPLQFCLMRWVENEHVVKRTPEI